MNKEIISEFIYTLINDGIKIWVESNENLKLFVPNNKLLTDSQKLFINRNKEKICYYLKINNIRSKITNTVILRTELQSIKLSFAQERLWFIEKYENGTTAYNIPMVFKLSDSIDIEILIKSIQDIISRHEILRTVIKEDEEGYGYQLVLDTNEYPLDIRRVKVVSKEELDTNLLQDSNHIYCLNKEYPIRVSLYNLEEEYYISIVIHHIAFDGWSGDILLNELQEYYLYNISQKRGLNRGLNLAPLSIQYKDFALWQRNYLTGERLEKQLVYWKEKLIGYETLNIITDNPRPKHFNYQGENVYFTIEKGTSNSLRELAKELKVSLYSLLLSAYYLTLSSYSNQDDIVIGTSVANRHYNQIENLIGFFVNTLALRINIDKKESIKSFIERVGNEVVSAQLHQDLPFEKLVEVLHIEQDTSRHPIFQFTFEIRNADKQEDITSKVSDDRLDLSCLLYPYIPDCTSTLAKFDISTFLDDTNEEIVGVFNYAVSLYKHDTIRLLQEAYVNILEQIANHFESKVGISGVRIHQLNSLSSYQYNQIINEWNNTDRDYPEDKTINQLFEEQVARTPEAIAIVYGDIQLTYDELNRKANQLANYLIRFHLIKADDLIGLYLDRSEYMLIAILGVLKSGGAYVPIDPKYPKERTKFILEDTNTKVVLTNSYYLDELESLKGTSNRFVVAIEDNKTRDILSKEPIISPDISSSSNNLAYGIYTSGTTGNPKGVLIQQQSYIAIVSCIKLLFFRDKSELLTYSMTDYVFDIFGIEFGLSLFTGGNVEFGNVELENSLDFKYFDFIQITPSLCSVSLDYFINTSKATLIIGGEVLNDSLLNKALDKFAGIMHVYGPTETTIWSIFKHYYKQKEEVKKVALNKLFDNEKIAILDRNLTILPIGAIGELYIGGVGLARGYLNRPDLTAEKFIANPFQTEAERKVGKNSRLYKTGDLVRWLPCGNIEYIGRNDFQVKIRGYRIELGEIESVLASYLNIKQAVVIARDSKNELEGNKTDNKYLVGYYTSSQELDNEAIRDYLENKLPEYMVPVVLMHLDKLPLTINGKLDTKALPIDELVNKDSFVVPRNEFEKQVHQVFAEILNLRPCQISIYDSFFKLGGNSILTLKLIRRLNDNFNSYLKIVDVFMFKNVELLTKRILQTKHKYQTIIELNNTKAQTNMFLIHPGIGGCEVYTELAYSLSTYFSCYGVDSYNLYNNNKIAKLHDLAQYYLKDIKKIMQNTYQVNYHLLGWSLGGLIALEVASILEKCNHKKINVYLLDTTLYSHLLPTKGKNLEKLKDYYKEYLLSKKYDKLYIDRVLSNIEIEEELMVQSISSVLKHTKVLLFKAMLQDFNFNISLSNISPQISSYNNIDKLLENLSNLTVVKVEHAYHNNILTQKKIIASHILEYNSIKAGYLI